MKSVSFFPFTQDCIYKETNFGSRKFEADDQDNAFLRELFSENIVFILFGYS